MDDASLDRLGTGKYLLVTSYRRNGTPVATPVWVVRDGDALGVWTAADSWKVKRIRAHADVLARVRPPARLVAQPPSVAPRPQLTPAGRALGPGSASGAGPEER
ncbi:hypothetical protein GCM10011578_098710 [Streptomyces fuscichromogenes]|uniref:Pyridoxamine 5'-phosphate oxidase putative domain-containing protein n=1 Tax=Streptomyces fuscichromogenes TaxID=1324013 RepID=A0A917XPP5_9ACTN|nr:hypothetical protein GCM10011578_098710 [Streptomyces fuscichromogenes]